MSKILLGLWAIIKEEEGIALKYAYEIRTTVNIEPLERVHC
jgi:hypothetical protein